MLKEHRFDTGELELNYAKGPNNGPPLILLHGGCSRWQAFLPIIPHLLLRHTLYALDLRGHGKSGRAAGRYRHADYAEDIRAFIEGKLGEPAAVLGSSLGGLIAVYLASQHAALVSALILDEPALWDPIHIPGVREFVERCHEFASLGKTAAELYEILQLKDVWGRRWAAEVSRLDPEVAAASVDASRWEGFGVEARLRGISCPALLLHGNPEKGSLLTREQAQYIVSTIPDCVSEYLEDAGHVIHREQPVKMAIMIADFLESL